MSIGRKHSKEPSFPTIVLAADPDPEKRSRRFLLQRMSELKTAAGISLHQNVLSFDFQLNTEGGRGSELVLISLFGTRSEQPLTFIIYHL